MLGVEAVLEGVAGCALLAFGGFGTGGVLYVLAIDRGAIDFHRWCLGSLRKRGAVCGVGGSRGRKGAFAGPSVSGEQSDHKRGALLGQEPIVAAALPTSEFGKLSSTLVA